MQARRRRLLALATTLPWAARPGAASATWQTALARAQAMREQAVRPGDQAYGAVVADATGRVLAEAPSRVVALNDANAHARIGNSSAVCHPD
ncbi:MAG: hypothetical protein ACKOD9_04120 [Rubrivivax sp.]